MGCTRSSGWVAHRAPRHRRTCLRRDRTGPGNDGRHPLQAWFYHTTDVNARGMQFPIRVRHAPEERGPWRHSAAHAGKRPCTATQSGGGGEYCPTSIDNRNLTPSPCGAMRYAHRVEVGMRRNLAYSPGWVMHSHAERGDRRVRSGSFSRRSKGTTRSHVGHVSGVTFLLLALVVSAHAQLTSPHGP